MSSDYDARCAKALGKYADMMGVSRSDRAWVKHGLRSALLAKLHHDFLSMEEISRMRRAYDGLVRDLERGKTLNARVLEDLDRAFDANRFVNDLMRGRELNGDVVAEACLRRMRNGLRLQADVAYVRRALGDT